MASIYRREGYRQGRAVKLHDLGAHSMLMVYVTAWSGFYFKLSPHCEKDSWLCVGLMVIVALLNAGSFVYCLLCIAYEYIGKRIVPQIAACRKRVTKRCKRRPAKITLRNISMNPMRGAEVGPTGTAFKNPMYRSERKSTVHSRMTSRNGIEMSAVLNALRTPRPKTQAERRTERPKRAEAEVRPAKRRTKRSKSAGAEAGPGASPETQIRDGDQDMLEHVTDTQWFEHYDRESKSPYYERKRTSTAWDLPDSIASGHESDNIIVDIERNSEDEEYYVIKRSTTLWTKPSDVDDNDVIVVSSAPKTLDLSKFSPENNVAEKHPPKNCKSDGDYRKTLQCARSNIKNGEVAPPTGTKAAGGWWQLLDQAGETCYLNTATGEVKYELPKSWVKYMTRQWEDDNKKKTATI